MICLVGEIFESLKHYAINNVPRKVTNILEVMKLAAYVEDFPPKANKIHLANGTLYISRWHIYPRKTGH
ncbi:MAG: hypothetical protein ACLTS1_08070 [Coprococcus sp.]